MTEKKPGLLDIKFDTPHEQAIFNKALLALFTNINSNIPNTRFQSPEDKAGPDQDAALYERVLKRNMLVWNFLKAGSVFGIPEGFAAAADKVSPIAKNSTQNSWPVSLEIAGNDMVDTALQLKDLAQLIPGQDETKLFAISGSLRITPPVRLTWEDKAGSYHHLTFPDASNNVKHLSETLGSSSLHVSKFLTDFSPQETGIINNVGQILLPSITDPTQTQSTGVIARLAALNVCNSLIHFKSSHELTESQILAAPTGPIQPNQSNYQDEQPFGVLVVSLPNSAEGMFKYPVSHITKMLKVLQQAPVWWSAIMEKKVPLIGASRQRFHGQRSLTTQPTRSKN